MRDLVAFNRGLYAVLVGTLCLTTVHAGITKQNEFEYKFDYYKRSLKFRKNEFPSKCRNCSEMNT